MTDAQALETFEALVLGQQPASGPWTPVTDYSFEARKQIEGKHPDLILEVFKSARILDAGMGAGHLVWLLREAQGLEYASMGADRWVAGFDPARGELCYGDLTKPHCGYVMWGPQMADLVICREVLEHLTVLEIHRAVTNLCALTSKYLYITTRFHLAPMHLLDVMTSDDLDPTHISMTNQAWLRHRIVLEGFQRRADLEAAMDWQGKGRVLVYERTT